MAYSRGEIDEFNYAMDSLFRQIQESEKESLNIEDRNLYEQDERKIKKEKVEDDLKYLRFYARHHVGIDDVSAMHAYVPTDHERKLEILTLQELLVENRKKKREVEKQIVLGEQRCAEEENRYKQIRMMFCKSARDEKFVQKARECGIWFQERQIAPDRTIIVPYFPQNIRSTKKHIMKMHDKF